MSLHPNAPYQDRVEEDGSVLIYEGHDEPRTEHVRNPKAVDQPEFLPSGNRSENGKFHKAAQDHKAGLKHPDIVRVYEKSKKESGPIMGTFIWSIHGANLMGLVRFSNSN